jgi:hypothetical protein
MLHDGFPNWGKVEDSPSAFPANVYKCTPSHNDLYFAIEKVHIDVL